MNISLVLSMAADAVSRTQGGNIYYLAAVDVTVGVLDAVTGTVGVTATTGNILDGQVDSVGFVANTPGFATTVNGPRVVNIIANAANLVAGVHIGQGLPISNPLDTSVNTLAASSGGSSYIYESDALTIGTVATTPVIAVHLSSDTSIVDITGRSGVISGEHAKIETIDGSLTVVDAVTAQQQILLAAGGAGSDLTLSAAVTSTNGPIYLLAQQNILQDYRGDVTVTTSATGTIYARAVAGSITMSRDNTQPLGNVAAHKTLVLSVRHDKRNKRLRSAAALRGGKTNSCISIAP